MTEKKVAREILQKVLSSIFSLVLKKSSNRLLSFLLTGVPGMLVMAIAVRSLEGLATLGVQLSMNQIFFNQVDDLVKKDLDEYNKQINNAYAVVFSKDPVSEIKKKQIIEQIKQATDKLVSLKDYVE